MTQRRQHLVLALLVAGLGFHVLTWVLLVPPFGGPDEWDHAFRASAVAHGQIVAPPSAATRGGGAVVQVAPDVLQAAQAECLGHSYTVLRDCIAGGTNPDGTVDVPSGAGRYSPAYYLLVGWAGTVVPGASGLLAQRAIAGALCVLLVALAARLVLRWSWPAPVMVALAVALTPVMVYAFGTHAPNGLEMAAGVLWWAGLLTLVVTGRRDRAVWAALGVAGVTLGMLRALGPLWVVASSAVLLVGLVGPGVLRRGTGREGRGRAVVVALRAWTRPRSARVVAVAVALSCVAGIAWTLSQRALAQPAPSPGQLTHGSLPGAMWYATWTSVITLIEAVTENPSRGFPPPPLTLAGWTIAFGLLALRGLGLLWYRSPSAVPPRDGLVTASGLRRCAALLLVTVVVLAWSAQVSTYRTLAFAWQGRYELPLSVGVPLLLGTAAATRRFLVPDAVVVGVATGVAHLAAVDYSLTVLSTRSVSMIDGAWEPSRHGLWACCLLAGCLVTAALVVAVRGDREPGGDGAGEAPAGTFAATSLGWPAEAAGRGEPVTAAREEA